MNNNKTNHQKNYPRDITYCANTNCTKTDCIRHDSKTYDFDPGALISMSIFNPKDEEECKEYIQE